MEVPRIYTLVTFQDKIIQSFNLLSPGDLHASMMWAIIGSGNGLAPVWFQAVAFTNADILWIEPLVIQISDLNQNTIIFYQGKWQQFSSGLNLF